MCKYPSVHVTFLLEEEEPQRPRGVGAVDDLDLVRADLVVQLADGVLDGLLVGEAHDVYVLELTEAVDPARGLDLVRRVEARLKEVEARGRRESDTHRAGPERDDQDFWPLFELLEVPYGRVAFSNLRLPVERDHVLLGRALASQHRDDARVGLLMLGKDHAVRMRLPGADRP